MSEDLNLFIEEAVELLDEIERNVMLVEKQQNNWEEPIKIIFGAIHTIKGNSLYLNLDALSRCCQQVESILADKNRSLRLPDQADFDTLFQFIDLTRDYCMLLSEKDDLEGLDGKLTRWLGSKQK